MTLNQVPFNRLENLGPEKLSYFPMASKYMNSHLSTGNPDVLSPKMHILYIYMHIGTNAKFLSQIKDCFSNYKDGTEICFFYFSLNDCTFHREHNLFGMSLPANHNSKLGRE